MAKSLQTQHMKMEASLHLKINRKMFNVSLAFFFFAVIFHSVIQPVNE